jgi:phenylalanyl-tRNA synthetase alpha chain
LRVEFLGKQGSISGLLKTLGAMSPEERQAQGPQIHALREAVTEALAAQGRAGGAALDAQLAARDDRPDAARARSAARFGPPGQPGDGRAGRNLRRLGFAVATGPEIEDDWHNFTALNMPESHPARAMHDTFYFPDKDGASGREMLLRTHTSPVQIRSMLAQGAPIRIIAPGRVYRSDSDATHTPMFHQVEGLVIDKGIHLGHLKWTLETFLKAFFEREDIVLRLRPSYFPFTEPSVEVDVGFRSKTASACSAAAAMRPATAGWSCSAAAWSTAR